MSSPRPRSAPRAERGDRGRRAQRGEDWGLTGVIGAVLVGLAIPGDDAWSAIVQRVGRAGRVLVPVFFTRASPALHWELIIPAIVLAVAGKLGGGLLGARSRSRSGSCSTPAA